MKKLVPVLLLALVLLLLLPAAASAGTMSLSKLTKAVKALQGKVSTLQGQVKTLQARQLLTGSGAPAATIGKSGNLYLDTTTLTLYGPKTASGWGTPTALKGQKGDTGAAGPQGPAGPDPAANPAYAGLFAIAPYVSVTQDTLDGVTGPNILFTGANIHIRSGSGSTADFEGLTGLGNLTIGYNENLAGTMARTGSHNLAVGVNNGFSSYGGAVFGRSNEIKGSCATVTGGRFNKASADYAAVSGGWDNEATAEGATVSGGQGFLLSGLYAWAAGSPAAGTPVIAPWFQSPN
jgi:hypothetical protein